MPTYDYECAEGHRFEVFQRIMLVAAAQVPDVPNFKATCDARGASRDWLGVLHKTWGLHAAFQDRQE